MAGIWRKRDRRTMQVMIRSLPLSRVGNMVAGPRQVAKPQDGDSLANGADLVCARKQVYTRCGALSTHRCVRRMCTLPQTTLGCPEHCAVPQQFLNCSRVQFVSPIRIYALVHTD